MHSLTRGTHSATTCFLVLVAITAFTAGWLFKKYPIESRNMDEVVAAEIAKQREQGVNITDVYLHKKAEIEELK